MAVFSPIVGACSDDDDSGDETGTTAPSPTSASSTASTAGPTTDSPTTAGTTTAAPTTAAPSPSTTASAPTTPSPSSEPAAMHRVNLGFVSAYILARGSTAAVVDTGVAGSADSIEEALGMAGLAWPDVAHLILTHHHPDHAGSVADVLTAASAAMVYAGEADIASITSPRPITAVGQGDDVFGLEIVPTPGHTAGHIAIFDPIGQLLVVGDALGNSDNVLTGPNPQFSDDMATAIQSAKMLATLPVESIVFGHGEPIESGGMARLVELAASL
jgi:glyoxylase-like metal-dependent hydrolase (beta-lactamase superfamily II)